MRETLDDRYKRLWRRTSLSIGAPLGNLEGGSSTTDFENGAFISEEAQCGGPLGRALLLGTLEDLRKTLDT